MKPEGDLIPRKLHHWPDWPAGGPWKWTHVL